MKPSDFPQRNVVFGEGQEEYIPIPAFRIPGIHGQVITLWRASWRERFKFLMTGELWLSQLTFNTNLQPMLPQLDTPIVPPAVEHATIGSEPKHPGVSGPPGVNGTK